MSVENVIETETEHNLLNTQRQLFSVECVVHVYVRLGIAGQRTVFVFGVVKILTTHKVCVPRCIESCVMEIEESVQDNGR